MPIQALKSSSGLSFSNDPVSLCMSYLMDLTGADMGVFSADGDPCKLFNIPLQSHQTYMERFKVLDPLWRPNSSTDKVFTFKQKIPSSELGHSEFYQEFTRPHRIADKAAMFLYDNDELFGTIALMRREGCGNFTPVMIEHLKMAHPLIEYMTAEIYLPKRQTQREKLVKDFGLTNRELDIVDLVRAGSSNKEIASALSIALPTVKSHVQHLFKKTGCRSRTELLASLYQI